MLRIPGSLRGGRGGRRDKKDRGVMQGRLWTYPIVDFFCFDTSAMLPRPENGGCFFPVEADDARFEVFHSCSKGGGIVIALAYVGVYPGNFFCDVGQANFIVKEPLIFGSGEYTVCKAGIT